MPRHRAALRWTLIASVAVLACLQVYPPVVRDNPPVTAPIEAPADVLAILRKGCFDCHSHETRWPWYSRVAPVSWLLRDHVTEGRAHMNFSTWGEDDAMTRAWNRTEIVRKVEAEEMPPPSYLLIHRSARPGPDEIDRLRAWAVAGR